MAVLMQNIKEAYVRYDVRKATISAMMNPIKIVLFLLICWLMLCENNTSLKKFFILKLMDLASIFFAIVVFCMVRCSSILRLWFCFGFKNDYSDNCC